MKILVSLLFATLLSATGLRTAEPWVCTQEGAVLKYTVRMGRKTTGAVVRTVKSVTDDAVVIEAREGETVRVEHWTAGPDSTVLRMEIPDEARQIAARAGAVIETVRVRDLVLPADMRPGDAFPGFEIEIQGGTQDGMQHLRFRMASECEVVSTEKVRLPAGRAEAVCIDLKTTTEIDSGGDEPMEIPLTMTQWYVAGLGLVRQEIPLFDAKIVQELTEMVKP